MDLRLMPMSVKLAQEEFEARNLKIPERSFDFAIAVVSMQDPAPSYLHGVIAMYADGKECSLAHLYTDGTALVGSLLYGAAWRAAKALGYKQITI